MKEPFLIRSTIHNPTNAIPITIKKADPRNIHNSFVYTVRFNHIAMIPIKTQARPKRSVAFPIFTNYFLHSMNYFDLGITTLWLHMCFLPLKFLGVRNAKKSL